MAIKKDGLKLSSASTLLGGWKLKKSEVSYKVKGMPGRNNGQLRELTSRM